MPNGTIQKATVTNGVTTMANGSRPPEGAVVHTANGDYMMKNGSGVKVTSVAVTTSSGKTTGYVSSADNKTYMPGGSTVSSGSIVHTQNGDYMMTSSGGVKVTSVPIVTSNGSSTGYISSKDNKTYMPGGNTISNGTIVNAANGTSYQMRNGSSVALPSGNVLVNDSLQGGYELDGRTYTQNGVQLPVGATAFIGGRVYQVTGKDSSTIVTSSAAIQKVGQNNSVPGYLINGRTYDQYGNTLSIGDRVTLGDGPNEKTWIMTKDGGVLWTPGMTTTTGNSNGFVQLPQSGTGYERYSIDDKAWGTPQTAANIQALGVLWATMNPNETNLRIGNISRTDGSYLGSASHRTGMDADIGTRRNDGTYGQTFLSDPTYSQEKTRELIQAILATGNVEYIFFNDQDLINEFAEVRYWEGHEDHLHVRYK